MFGCCEIGIIRRCCFSVWFVCCLDLCFLGFVRSFCFPFVRCQFVVHFLGEASPMFLKLLFDSIKGNLGFFSQIAE